LEEEKDVRLVLALGFCKLFSSILSLNDIKLLDQWILKEFSIELKTKFEVHQEHFLEVFPSPTLYSYASFLDRKPSCHVIPDEFSPTCPQFYPQISIENHFLQSKLHLFIHLIIFIFIYFSNLSYLTIKLLNLYLLLIAQY
jgi:hypothetical protein